MNISEGEQELQQKFGSRERATRFYDRQIHDHLTQQMQTFIRRQEMVFIATADARGNCDCSPGLAKWVLWSSLMKRPSRFQSSEETGSLPASAICMKIHILA